MDEDLQLDLFSQDRIKVREGFNALARLDLAGAAATFAGVLSRWPGHPDGSAGLRMAAAWDVSLKEVETLPRKDGAAALWERIKSYPFGQGGEPLRRSLMARAIALLENDCQFHRPPDVCLGRFLLEVENFAQAEVALRRLLESRPFDGGVWVTLGNCLFRQNKRGEARLAYAKAFLVAPGEVERGEIDDKDLLEAISDEDNYSAAVYGWLRRVLPLIEVDLQWPHDMRHEESLRVYRTVGRAERARAKGAHDEMVEQRRVLKQLAPAVFREYMGRL